MSTRLYFAPTGSKTINNKVSFALQKKTESRWYVNGECKWQLASLQLVVVLISATLVGVKGVDDWLDDTLELLLHFFNVFGFSGLHSQFSIMK